MKTQPDLIEEYRNQIRRCAQSLAVARTDVVNPFLLRVDEAELVDVFADGNLDKRVWKLTDQFEFMKDEFDELDEWIGEYIRTVPLAAYDTGSTDSVLFLDWIEEMKTLTPEQTDLMTCHKSRIEVEETARVNRIGHVRFQEMLSATGSLLDELESNENLRVYLNPVRVWTRFETNVLLDDEEDLPATVIFYPVGNDVRTAVLEPIGQIVIDALETKPVDGVEEMLSAFPYDERAEILDLTRDLAEMGLIALG